MKVNYDIIIIGGIFMFSVLVSFIFMFIVLYQKRYYKHLREKLSMKNQFEQDLLKTQLETQEETFHQISEELHDNIGQLLSSSKLLMNIARKEIQYVPDTLNTAEETLAKAIMDLRAMSKSLNKEWLHQFNVIENLNVEAARINTARTIVVQIHSTVGQLPLSPESQVVLFRIIQEGLQNGIKHGNPKNISVYITCLEKIEVMIQDDGKGFDTATLQKDGIGLMNMKHRTKLIGGTIVWKSVINEGTQVCIDLPIQQKDV